MTEFSVDVQDIYDSPLLKDKEFPDGKRLEVIATVYESATGNEEAESHEATIFTKRPFDFKFTKSRVNFRPGYEYYLKVLTLLLVYLHLPFQYLLHCLNLYTAEYIIDCLNCRLPHFKFLSIY